MFLPLIVFSVLTAELPQCPAGDTVCLSEVITRIISEHPNGHTGLSIPPLEPLRINSIDIIQGAESPINIHLHFKNLDLNGISKIITRVVGFEADILKSKYEIYSKLPLVTLEDATFDEGGEEEGGYENDNRFDQILFELRKLNKKETRNAANIKVIAQKMMEEEAYAEEFSYPLRTEDKYELFQKCLKKSRFKLKLVAWLEQRIKSNSTMVSDLIEAIFHPQLLALFTVYGMQGKYNFDNAEINKIFYNICLKKKMTHKEYYADLTKVVNKMHMRYNRLRHEY